jgi:hypothetical protein
MFTYCATAAPTRHPPGEALSLPALAPLVTTFAAGPLPANRASEASSRRLAAHPIRPRHPLSSSLSPTSTPQLQPAQPLSTRVAKNAVGDTRRHATPRPAGGGSLLPLAAFHAKQAAHWQKVPDPLNVSFIAKLSRGWPRLAYSPTWAAQPQEAVPFPLSPLASLSATPQLQPAQPLSTRVAKNALGDTTRHATELTVAARAAVNRGVNRSATSFRRHSVANQRTVNRRP